MERHADILKLAQTKEKRERIKWFHARQVFFSPWEQARGLELARQCDHEDARFLVSLFPDGPPKTRPEASNLFLAHGDEDARCLCWAAMAGKAGEDGSNLRRSAERGYVWARAKQAKIGWPGSRGHQVELREAAALGEREAFFQLAVAEYDYLTLGEAGCDAKRNCLEAALLGCPHAQSLYGTYCCPELSLEQITWLRRALSQSYARGYGEKELFHRSVDVMRAFDEGGSSRVVFELGKALEFANKDRNLHIETGDRAIALFHHWSDEARKGVICWLWAGKQLGLAKDIRRVIANMVWEERAAWSHRAIPQDERLLRKRSGCE